MIPFQYGPMCAQNSMNTQHFTSHIRFVCATLISAAAIWPFTAPGVGAPFEVNAQAADGLINLTDVDEARMLWGEITNVIVGNDRISGTFSNLPPVNALFRSGIEASNGLISVSLTKNVAVSKSYMAIENVTTNLIIVFLPEYNQRFSVVLTDTNGASVERTSEGHSVGQTPNVNPIIGESQARRNGYHLLPLWPNDIFEQEINPLRYFVLKEPGDYKLTLTQRLYVEDTNTFLKVITLPPISVDVRVEK